MNGVDLNAFRFDYDLTWMAFFQNENGRTYMRYGGRDDRDSESYLTQKSLVAAMEKTLELHQSGTVKKESKYEPVSNQVQTPEQLVELPKMLAKRKESCIHCHDVKNAKLRELYNKNELKKYYVYTYPSPARIGVTLNSDDQTKVEVVREGSSASRAGLMVGDRIRTVNQHPVYTFGDFSRVLELAESPGKIQVSVDRLGQSKNFSLSLSNNWKQSPDASWRPSVSMVGPSGGFWASPVSVPQRKKLKLSQGQMAMKVVVIWGDWARKAGIRKGDVVTEVDGLTNAKKMRQIHAHLQLNREFGETIQMKVIRGGRMRELTMTLPDSPPTE